MFFHVYIFYDVCSFIEAILQTVAF